MCSSVCAEAQHAWCCLEQLQSVNIVLLILQYCNFKLSVVSSLPVVALPSAPREASAHVYRISAAAQPDVVQNKCT
jgi:hypothetical protein